MGQRERKKERVNCQALALLLQKCVSKRKKEGKKEEKERETPSKDTQQEGREIERKRVKEKKKDFTVKV